MPDRASVEAAVRSLYAARGDNDVEAVLACLHDRITFEVVGSSRTSELTGAVEGRAAVEGMAKRLIESFVFSDLRVVKLVIEGDDAVVVSRVRVRVPATGREAETELCDLLTFEGEKVASYRQFADTALANWLVEGPS